MPVRVVVGQKDGFGKMRIIHMGIRKHITGKWVRLAFLGSVFHVMKKEPVKFPYFPMR